MSEIENTTAVAMQLLKKTSGKSKPSQNQNNTQDTSPMTIEADKQTLGFQAEVKQLLHLMINALYSNKEIFLRELISNASDATDKLRFEALSNSSLYEGNSDLKVRISFDKDQRTITLADNGIGMSREEVIQNLGTIAKSGTQEFLTHLSGDQAKDAQLIGQFGVGFYSAFIVADKVVVETRRAGLTAEEGVRWESTGEGEYTIGTLSKPARGTTVTLHLKPEEDEFLDDWRLRMVIKKYSDHITLPIILIKPDQDNESSTEETVNQATALWTLAKSEIKDSEYKEFYKHIAHDLQDPLTWSHNRVEGKQEYISLLYIPSKTPFDLFMKEHRQGLKLYVNRVFIMDEAEHFLPNYLRFVRGVLDTNDLPLNISREILQSNKLVDALRNGLIQRVLTLLEKLTEDKAQYARFWSNFGQVLKEGIIEDNTNQKAIAKLLKFKSTHSDKEDVSLDDYINRMKPEQEKIYYLTAGTLAAAKASPHLEIFRKKDIEVLLLTDKVDEWIMMHLTDYADKPMQSVTKGALDLGQLEDESEKDKHQEQARSLEGLIKQVKEALGERVKEVRLTYRLVDSPACIVADEQDISGQLQRILKQAGQDIPTAKPIFELNPEHPIIQRIKEETDDERFEQWINILFDQAVLTEGGQLQNPGAFVHRLNKFLQEAA